MKQLVIALSAALVVCFVVIAFLAGRMSAPIPPIAPVVVQQPPAAPIIETRPVEQTRPPVIVQIPPAPQPVSHRAEIEAYFTKIKTEQVLEGSDPNAYAQELMGRVIKGDPTAYDDILAGAEKAERTAQAITPPKECAEYHRAVLALIAETKGLIQEMRGAKGMDSLGGIAQKAQSMQTRADALEEMEKEIRAQSQAPGG